jgi:hypothetical protein
MSFEEWDSLPWYQQQIYLNGFREEGILSKGDGSEPGPTTRSPVPSSGGGRKIDLTSADLSELGDSFTVRRAG